MNCMMLVQIFVTNGIYLIILSTNFQIRIANAIRENASILLAYKLMIYKINISLES